MGRGKYSGMASLSGGLRGTKGIPGLSFGPYFFSRPGPGRSHLLLAAGIGDYSLPGFQPEMKERVFLIIYIVSERKPHKRVDFVIARRDDEAISSQTE